MRRRSGLEPISIRVITGGWHVKDLEFKNEYGEAGCIHVYPMLVNFRICRYWGECDSPASGWDLGYCYAGGSQEALVRAVSQALEWDGTPQSPPRGWIKATHSGEYYPEGYFPD